VEEKQLSVQLLLPAASAATLAVGERFTPGREEYRAIKETHSDCVICFRMGKFYELFEEDAVLGHSELDLAFIGKGAPHVGFPEAALPMYSQKLFERGYKVGVVSAGVFEQMESSSDTYSS
jgi:DNA mismatch repair protein MSH6